MQRLQDCSSTRLLNGIRPETIISGSFSAVQQICRDSVPLGQCCHLTCLRGLEWHFNFELKEETQG